MVVQAELQTATHLRNLMRGDLEHFGLTLHTDLKECKKAVLKDWQLSPKSRNISWESAKLVTPAQFGFDKYWCVENLVASFDWFAEMKTLGTDWGYGIYGLWCTLVEEVFPLDPAVCRAIWLRRVLTKVSPYYYRQKALSLIAEQPEVVEVLVGGDAPVTERVAVMKELSEQEWVVPRLCGYIRKELHTRRLKMLNQAFAEGMQLEADDGEVIQEVYCQECESKILTSTSKCEDPEYPIFRNCWEHKG